MSNLCYESRITIDPVYDDGLIKFKEIAANFNFRVADLVMNKGGSYSVPSTQDAFATSRSKDYTEIVNNTINMISALQSNKFHVRRYKIEDTLVDSRIEDRFQLL